MESKVKKSSPGRPSLYGEKTESISYAVPISKKAFIQGVVEALLESYKIKK